MKLQNVSYFAKFSKRVNQTPKVTLHKLANLQRFKSKNCKTSYLRKCIFCLDFGVLSLLISDQDLFFVFSSCAHDEHRAMSYVYDLFSVEVFSLDGGRPQCDSISTLEKVPFQQQSQSTFLFCSLQRGPWLTEVPND